MRKGNESYIKCPGHVTKMAATPISGKRLYESSSLKPDDLV